MFKKLGIMIVLLLVFPSLLYANRLRVIAEGTYEIPNNYEWDNYNITQQTNEYIGFDTIGEFCSKSKIVIGYFISDKNSTSLCTDLIFGSTENYKDICYQYVQLSFRITDNIGYIRINRVCVNPMLSTKTLPSLIGNKIKWILLQTN